MTQKYDRSSVSLEELAGLTGWLASLVEERASGSRDDDDNSINVQASMKCLIVWKKSDIQGRLPVMTDMLSTMGGSDSSNDDGPNLNICIPENISV
ncbi:hypothetical protein CVT25_000135 [Psilocybe cyanescens]|uniref:Uncharacterized protein n=1 Tax=Psilocybe cyanescens TaxID=93625 RepID=A0A409WZ34_PSICY|nr:hypothetical protein CVT25_000135 [Psilocybe cyanescens]